MSTTSVPAFAVARSAGSASGAGPPCIPIDVQFTTASYPARDAPGETALTPRNPAALTLVARRSPRAASRFEMSNRPTRVSASAKAMPRAAPPAPINRIARPSGSKWPSLRNAATKPGPSVLKPNSRPPRFTIVLTAPTRALWPPSSSSIGKTDSLYGMVTFAPSTSAERSPATRASRPLLGVSQRSYAVCKPQCMKAAD